jgi:RNA polymerase sigma-70 factor (ECF subfamily)
MSFTLRIRGLSYSTFWNGSASGVLDQEASESESRQKHFPSDEELIQRVAARDPSALCELMNRYARLVMRIAARILRDSGEAEDLAQEVFLYVHRKAAAFDPLKGTGRGWIVQLAYHRAFDRRAFLGRRGFYDGTDNALLVDRLLGTTDLEHDTGACLSRIQLRKAFEELPGRQRQTLELFYFEGLQLREIGDRLGETFENVRHHYYRGLQKLRKNAIVQNLRDTEK